MGYLDGSRFCVAPQSEGKSALTTHPELGSPTSSPHLRLPQPLAACCRPRSFVLVSHSSRTVRFISGLYPTRVVLLLLLPLLLRLSSLLSRADGSKTHRRGVQSNCGGEWLGTGAP